MSHGHLGLGRGVRAPVAAGSAMLVIAFLVVVGVGPAAATVFSNSATIAIPDYGSATPYPSTITVSGLAGTIVDVNATLTGLSHTAPQDVDVLLVGPFGQNVILMTDCGDLHAISDVNLTFDGQATKPVPFAGTITSGTYMPTPSGPFDGTYPAPAGPYGLYLSGFNGTNPNGTWSLYVFDDTSIDSGSISGGWSLDITTNGPAISSFNPTSGGAGTSVVITGTNFTGAISVTFGGATASYTVNSATQITAVVPPNAVTGPIAVTTPNGTATSSANFAVVAGPTITSFNPTAGMVGTAVAITGTAFTGATAVKFNATAAAFTATSDTQIIATVPQGATAGPISVTTPGGTGASTAVFVVQHARSVWLSVGKRASGDVTVTDGFAACGASVPVKIQHFDKGHGKWKTVASVLSQADGGYSARGVEESGKYRAIAKRVKLGSGDMCSKGISPIAKK